MLSVHLKLSFELQYSHASLHGSVYGFELHDIGFTWKSASSDERAEVVDNRCCFFGRPTCLLAFTLLALARCW